MSTHSDPIWAPVSKSVEMEPAFGARFEMRNLRSNWNFVCATIAVLGIQAVIRGMILMRKLNY
jgi:hypothetical protein